MEKKKSNAEKMIAQVRLSKAKARKGGGKNPDGTDLSFGNPTHGILGPMLHVC